MEYASSPKVNSPRQRVHESRSICVDVVRSRSSERSDGTAPDIVESVETPDCRRRLPITTVQSKNVNVEIVVNRRQMQ